ncbi:uncharacterized protein LOC131062314 isoform X1 [Cryptomeria japonica]|uniref:uncharacterized protein LOC131062314 isoform X1 n=1 Tax=Cryptomeria japonica TaxID=3369 RepID=UPI0027DA7FCA|nr:uncharacterized protein LOC131062314 isoform X1 [Cryptomeria japonica]XP_059065226.1 uncharacterized protein LOC131062314 isoform X1 [Cryptomeria japonica]XP_059065227.1 uncharacterized protein LOC131062314 isoform X1 [Cryptomeria japonica]
MGTMTCNRIKRDGAGGKRGCRAIGKACHPSSLVVQSSRLYCVVWKREVEQPRENGGIPLETFGEEDEREVAARDNCRRIRNGEELKQLPWQTGMRNVGAWTGTKTMLKNFFKEMWSHGISVVAGYSPNGFVLKALGTFEQMRVVGVKPDSTTFAIVLPACAKIKAFE